MTEPKISISTLIYKSTKFADFVYNSLMKYTPEILTGEAEFYFIANDASDNVIEHLKNNNYPYYINNNPVLTEKELFKMGYGWPEYINRVYKGYNEAIKKAKGDIIILINSDHAFSKDWLKNLLIHLNEKNVVSPKTLEPGTYKHGVFPDRLNGTGALKKSFGTNTSNFDDNKFQEFVEQFKTKKITKGGVFMPCCMYKKNAFDVGLYPEGNIAGKNYKTLVEYGDVCFFRKLREKGIEHITTWDSIVYHFKEGEKND